MNIVPTDIGEVRSYLIGEGFPADLTESHVSRAIDQAFRSIRTKAPLVNVSGFITSPGQNTYDLFNYARVTPAPAATLDPLGLRVLELEWAPTPQYSIDPSQLVFFQGPGFGPYNGRGVFPFDQMLTRESDALIYEQSSAALRKHFTHGHWHHASTDMGAPVVLDPVPVYSGSVYLQYVLARTDVSLASEFYTPLMTMIEAVACRTVSRLSRTTAGIKFALLDDNGKKSAMWLDEAVSLESRALSEIADVLTGEISPASRS